MDLLIYHPNTKSGLLIRNRRDDLGTYQSWKEYPRASDKTLPTVVFPDPIIPASCKKLVKMQLTINTKSDLRK